MKKVFIESANFGVKVTKEAFQIKGCYEKGNEFHFTISDRSGSMDAMLVDVKKELVDLLRNRANAIFLVDGVIVNCPVEGKTPEKQLRVTDVVLARPGDYISHEVYGGISAEAKEFHINQIKTDVKKLIRDVELKSLVDVLLTDEVLEKLSSLPVTIADYGNYVGGALVATSQITGLAVQQGVISSKRNSGLCHVDTDFSLLATATVLSQVARPEFFSEGNPFEKSKSGVILNYFPLLQKKILQAIMQNGIIVDDVKLNTLLNILNVSLTHSDVVAVSKEALIVSQAIDMYRKLELYEAGFQAADFGEGDSAKSYVYGEKGNFYYLAPPVAADATPVAQG